MENHLSQTTGNISYVTGTPDPTVFRLGMTQAGRSPYERWAKDGDYAKLDYAMADQVHEFFELSDKLDHDVFRVLLLRNPDIIRLKDVADVRSPEIFKCERGWDYFLSAAKHAIAEVTGAAKPIRFKISTRPYQHSFVEQFKASKGDFLLFAKCRAGKSVMTLLAATESGYRSAVVVSYRTSAANSWRDDARRYTVFHEWDVIDLASPTWESEIASSKGAGRRQLMISTVQRQREEFGYVKKLAAQYPKGVDLLALDECHVGGESSGFQLLKKNLKYSRLLEISGTAYRAIWKYPEERRFVWGYVEEQRAKAEGHEWAQSLPRMELVLAKYNASDLANVYGDDPDALKNVFSVEDGKWKDPGSVQAFLRKFFSYGAMCRKQQQLLHGTQHAVMTVPSVEAAHLLAESLTEFGSPYAPLVVTSDTGNNQETILRHVRTNEATITLTRWANVLGVTVPQWDTVIHACEYDSAEFWVQFTFRGGSTKRESWRVIDLAPERGIQSFIEMAAATSAAQDDTDTEPVLRTLLDFADVFEFNEGYERVDYDNLIQSGFGAVASAEAETRAAQSEVTVGSNLDSIYEIFHGADDNKKVAAQALVNANGTEGSGNAQRSGVAPGSDEVNKVAEAKKAIKKAVSKLDDVVWGALLHGEHLSTLPKLLAYEKFEVCTGCSPTQFQFAIDSGWIPSPDKLNARVARIHHHLNTAIESSVS